MITRAIVEVGKIQFIKNIRLPSCADCNYYIAGTAKTGKCTKFGEKDIITGKITYENALHTRLTENMCSITGHYFEKK